MNITMLEASGMMGWLSGALLFAALAAWLKLRQGPALPLRTDDRPSPNTQEAEKASRLLVIACGASAVSAVLAAAGWVSA
jgi:hypothetical protein